MPERLPTSRRRLVQAAWLVGSLAVFAVAGPLAAPHDPLQINLDRRFEPPSDTFLLGTDRLGRCVLSRTLTAARASLGLALATATTIVSLALAVGMVSASSSRTVDRITQRAIDVLIAFPPLVLALAIVGVVGPSLPAIVAAIVWASWPGEARISRTLVDTARHRDFVDAAELSGVSRLTVLRRHVLPQLVPAVAVRLSLEVGSVTASLAALGFLGLGVQPPYPEWGMMLNEARPFLAHAPHLLIGPGTALVLTVVACNAIAEGLRDQIDARHGASW